MGKKTLLVALLTMCLLLAYTSLAFGAAFSDVQGNWAETQIKKWAEKGLVGGYLDGTFKPNNEVTRAEFVALVNRAFGITNAGAEANFTDVQEGQWCYQDVAAAKAAGYIAGYTDGSFRPNQTITRQEVASILVRLMDLEQTTEGLEQFNDAGQIPAWSRGAIGAIVKAGLMVGYTDGTFQAVRSITRAEAVVTLDRALDYKAGPVVITAIEGTVTLDGKAVDGATVRVFEAGGYKVLKETTSDSNGKYKVELETGTYDLTAATESEVAYASGVKVTAAKASVTDLSLEAAAVISGVLEDKSGKAVKNTTILFTTNPTFVTETNTRGEYTVPVLPNREYTVRAYDPGEEEAEPEVVEESLEVGSAGAHDIGALQAPFSVGVSFGGGGGAPTTPEGPIVLGENDIKAGQTYDNDRGYKIASFGTFGPADGQTVAVFTSKLIIDPGDDGTLILQNIEAQDIEVLSGGKETIKPRKVKANKLVAKAASGVKIEAGAGTEITEFEVAGETHIAVATDAQGDQKPKIGKVKIKPAAGSKSVEFSGDLTETTVTLETGDVTLRANNGAQTGKVVVEAAGAIKLEGQGSFGEVEVSEEAGTGGTPVIEVAQGTSVAKLVLSTTVKIEGNGAANVPLEVTDPDTVEIIVDDQDNQNQLIETAVENATSAIALIKDSITIDDEATVVSARNRVNAIKVLTKYNDEQINTHYPDLGIDSLKNAEAVISTLKQISIGYASGDSAGSVTQNLTLSTTVNSLTVTWTSNNTGVISNNGIVTRPQSDVTVTLTATINKGGITGKKTFRLTVLGMLVKPKITSFAGANVAGNVNTIQVSLSNIHTNTGIEVNKDAKLALNVEGLGTVRQLTLQAGKVNNIYNILIPAADEIDLSELDLSLLAQATRDCPPATKEEVLKAINFTGLFEVLKGSPGIKDTIITETNLSELMATAQADNNINKADILDAVDFAGVINAVRYDDNITRNDIFSAVQLSELVVIVYAIEDDVVRNEILSAVDINDLAEAETKEEVFNAVDFVALFDAISKTSESTKDQIVQAVNFTALFDLIKKANSATTEAIFDSISFTSLFSAISGASDGTIAKTVEVTLEIIDIMQKYNITRGDILDNIEFSQLDKVDIFNWLSCIDGNSNVLTIEAILTDINNEGNNNTYTININQ